jgi:hypothetical protein
MYQTFSQERKEIRKDIKKCKLFTLLLKSAVISDNVFYELLTKLPIGSILTN